MCQKNLLAANLPKRRSVVQCAIIVVTWNCWDHLYRCLDALVRQTFSNFRVIIIDNGDSNPEQVRRAELDERITYVKSRENLGFAAGNNRGLDLVRNVPLIVLLNPDTVPTPTWLETMLDAAARHPEHTAFGCRLRQMHNPELLDGEGDRYHISGFAWRAGMGLRPRPAGSTTWEAFSPCAAAALYRVDTLREVGGFDSDFFCYMEDVDLGFRLRLAGYRSLIVPQAEVLHVGSATTGRRSEFYVYYGQRNLVWTYVKNMPGILFWAFLPLHVALNVVALLYYAIRGQGKTVWRAKYDAVLALPKIWCKRRAIQRVRVASLVDILKVLDMRLIPGLGRSASSIWK